MWIALAAPGGFLRFPENSQVYSANWNCNLICKSDLNTLIEQSTTLIEQSHLVVMFAWAKTIRCKCYPKVLTTWWLIQSILYASLFLCCFLKISQFSFHRNNIQV